MAAAVEVGAQNAIHLARTIVWRIDIELGKRCPDPSGAALYSIATAMKGASFKAAVSSEG